MRTFSSPLRQPFFCICGPPYRPQVIQAVRKAVADAKRNLVTVPLNKNASFPHRIDGHFGAAKVRIGRSGGLLCQPHIAKFRGQQLLLLAASGAGV